MTIPAKAFKGVTLLCRCSAMGLIIAGCSSSQTSRSDGITVVSSETLEEYEGYIPIPPDSVVELYRTYTQEKFYLEYGPQVRETAILLDSLNQSLPPSRVIDTLSIEFALEHFGTAVRTGRSICLSSGFFFVYNNPSILRSILFHEHGHVRYDMLSPESRSVVGQVWESMRRAALLYVFVDGEYSGNAWFGGHPEESPEELYASAFNLFHNQPDELRATIRYVPQEHYGLIDTLRSATGVKNVILFE